MKNNEKQQIINKPAIGCWSALGGIEVKSILYGIDDTVEVVSGAWTQNKRVHRIKIHYETESPYILVNGQRYKFDECVRTNI